MVVVDSKEFQAVMKLGLSKVKGAECSLSASKKYLTLHFNNPTVQFQYKIDSRGESLHEYSFDGVLLQTLTNNFKDEMEIEAGGSYLLLKNKRSKVTLPTLPPSEQMYTEDSSKDATKIKGFSGSITDHPLHQAETIKKSLQSIKDNISGTDLVVEAQWGGKQDFLKIMVVDQFHGLLANLENKQEVKGNFVKIHLPLTSLLLLMDLRGDLYVGETYIEVKSERSKLRCAYLSGEGVASIEEFETLMNAGASVYVQQTEVLAAMKKVIKLAEPDDSLTMYAKKTILYVGIETSKGSIKEGIECRGVMDKVNLSPKNALDIFAGIYKGEVGMTVANGNLLVYSSLTDKERNVSLFGATVLMED